MVSFLNIYPDEKYSDLYKGNISLFYANYESFRLISVRITMNIYKYLHPLPG